MFIKQTPPYTDAVSGKIKGIVSLIHLKDNNCDKCTELTVLIDGLKQDVKITDEKIIDISSSKGKELIAKYEIKQVPTLILSDDISFYTTISETWDQVGTIEDDGSYVVRDINPPFIDTSTNKITGLVDLILLTDEGCVECYDVEIHKPILERFGVIVDNEETVDIGDNKGKALVKKYDIKSVPTIILSEDAGVYKSLKQVWLQIGSVEEDGTYIFRELSAVNAVYKDLTTGEIIS